jgi:hypothetical protein
VSGRIKRVCPHGIPRDTTGYSARRAMSNEVVAFVPDEGVQRVMTPGACPRSLLGWRQANGPHNLCRNGGPLVEATSVAVRALLQGHRYRSRLVPGAVSCMYGTSFTAAEHVTRGVRHRGRTGVWNPSDRIIAAPPHSLSSRVREPRAGVQAHRARRPRGRVRARQRHKPHQAQVHLRARARRHTTLRGGSGVGECAIDRRPTDPG